MQHHKICASWVFVSVMGSIFFFILLSFPYRTDAQAQDCCYCSRNFYQVCRSKTPDDTPGDCQQVLDGGVGAGCVSTECFSNNCKATMIQPSGECWKCPRSRDQVLDGGGVLMKGTYCYPKTTDQIQGFISQQFVEPCVPIVCNMEPACYGGATADRSRSPGQVIRFMPNITLPFSKIILFNAGQEIDVTPETLPTYIAEVFKFLVGIAGLLSLVMIMLGGYRWVMAAGAEEGITEARKMVVNALMGLALALVSYLVLQTISPGLVNLRGFRPQYVMPLELGVRETESVDPGVPTCEPGKPCEGQDGVPLYKQGQEPWRNRNFGNCPEPTEKEIASAQAAGKKKPTSPTYAYAGCGAMSVAMVMKYYNENTEATPIKVGNAIIESKSRICGQGSNIGGFVAKRKLGKVLGAGEVTYVLKLLKEKKPVIAHVGCIERDSKGGQCLVKWQNKYTGHYVVLTGIEGDEDNPIIHVNDSAGGNVTQIRKADLEKGILRFIVINEYAQL